MKKSDGIQPLRVAEGIFFYLIFPAAFSAAYVLSAKLIGPSSIAAGANFTSDAPFVYRFLIPRFLSLLISDNQLDTFGVRWACAFLATGLIMKMIPIYSRVVLQTPSSSRTDRWFQASCGIILIAHYVLPHRYHFYFVYDIPAIVFYLTIFLSLQNQSRIGILLPCLVIAIASLNRETAIIAVIHSFFLSWQSRNFIAPSSQASAKARRDVFIVHGACALTLCVASAVLHLAIHAKSGNAMELFDGDQLRISRNLYLVTHQFQHAAAIFYFGFGALIWMPVFWHSLPSRLKRIAIASMPILTLFLLVGNPTELRIYNEIIPILATGLGYVARNLICRAKT